MTERRIDSGFWGNPDVIPLSPDAKLLYLYSFTNPHCNQCGCYKISLSHIALETKIDIAEIPELFKQISAKVEWFPADNILWVKNFIKRQVYSPKFMVAVGKSLNTIKNTEIVKTVLEYNKKVHNISIPYQYHTDTLPIPSYSTSYSLSHSLSNKGVVKGEGEVSDNGLVDIVSIYETNIGIITQMTAERLKDIADSYPVDWFREAVSEAIGANVRNLNYIEAILRRWQAEGKKTRKEKAGGKVEQDNEKPGADEAKGRFRDSIGKPLR